MTDLETWLLDNEGVIFRMWEKRTPGDWTPYEMDKKYSDESNLKCNIAENITIIRGIELPDGDVLLEINKDPYEELFTKPYHDFVKLSEIKLAYSEEDNTLEEEETE